MGVDVFKQNFIYKNYTIMDVDEFEKDHVEHKKQEIKEYILYGFIYLKS